MTLTADERPVHLTAKLYELAVLELQKHGWIILGRCERDRGKPKMKNWGTCFAKGGKQFWLNATSVEQVRELCK